MDWNGGIVDWKVWLLFFISQITVLKHTIKRTVFSYPRCCYFKPHTSGDIEQCSKDPVTVW